MLMDHVVVRSLEHLTGEAGKPALGFAVETRDRPGPAYKEGSSPDDVVWVQLDGGLLVAKARIRIGWVGEYASVDEVRARTAGSALWASIAPGSVSTPSLTTSTSISPTCSA